jgi:hypothetical protein
LSECHGDLQVVDIEGTGTIPGLPCQDAARRTDRTSAASHESVVAGVSAFARAARPAWYAVPCDGTSTEEIPMNTLRGTTRVPALAVLMASLLLAACGPGPAPADEASAPLATAAVTRPGSTAAAAHAGSAVSGRDAPVPTRVARASDVAPDGVCPSQAEEPATIDGGREVTQVAEPDVPDAAPAPVPAEAGRP